MKKILLNPFSMLLSGMVLGIVSRLLDIYTQTLGNIFSELAIWILIGVLISIYSSTKKKAIFNIFPFCIGMLVTYYFAAYITNGIYSNNMITGWTIFALCSPVLGYITWMTKERGFLPKMISIGIIIVSLLTSVVIFDRLRIYDLIINGILIYFLFVKKIER